MSNGVEFKQATTSIPNPTNTDAYDTLLLNTTKFTANFSGTTSAAVFTLDSDTAKGALTIKLHPLSRNAPPFFAYTVDILQQDVVVQSVVNSGTQAEMDGWKMPPLGQSMDRGSSAPLSVEYQFKNPGICDICVCKYNESSMIVTQKNVTQNKEEQGFNRTTMLVAKEELNTAFKTRAILDCCCAVPTCCSGPVFLSCCLPSPDKRYGLQEGSEGSSSFSRDAGYIIKGHTCFRINQLRGLPDGAVIMFADDTDLCKRRDMVLAFANYIGKVAALPDTA